MTGFWKSFRIIISVVIFASISLIFFDVRHIIPSAWFDGITYLQFIPSILKFISFAGFLSAGFLMVLLLTVFFGRVYCSTICPLGTLQDIIGFIAKKIRTKKHHFSYAKPKPWLRYFFLALVVISLLFGSTHFLYLLDPYSNFGRFASDLFNPALVFFNNLLSDIFIKFRITTLPTLHTMQFRWALVIFPLSFLGSIVLLALFRGRLYCNTVCPVGTLLGLLSKYSLNKININQSQCTQCGKCSLVCKAQCIGVKEYEVDFSRCVGCFNCLNACENGSIGYRRTKKTSKTTKPWDQITDDSRRRFLKNSFLLSGSIVGLSGMMKAYKIVSDTNAKKHFCSPPGSKSIHHFNNTCTACHLCVSACPGNVLQPSLLEYGLAGILQPYMDYNKGFCEFECVKCSEICPAGAIISLTPEEKKTYQIGVASFIFQNCRVYTEGAHCGHCEHHCPKHAITMIPYKNALSIPVVNEALCIGCGACEHVCPAHTKAIFVKRNLTHKIIAV